MNGEDFCRQTKGCGAFIDNNKNRIAGISPKNDFSRKFQQYEVQFVIFFAKNNCMPSKQPIAKGRRSFLKNGFALAAGFYILPRHVLGGPGFVAPSDKLLIAGIGAGGKGESDLWNFYNGGKAEIAILCDVDEKRCAKNRERFPKAKFYHD